ncbi:MAG: CinA family protein [Oscillospiraceae bacterium]|nr:CinA family protein [Oscillospiraceae bacterium]
MEKRVIEKLRERGLLLATAESCTGGLCAKRLTDVPGASQVFCGGVVSYTNDVKMRLLGVKEETLAQFGAVSGETAREMAEGARQATGADVAVSVTGVAGPSSDEMGNVVGTVFIAFSSEQETISEKLQLSGDREKIREQSVNAMLWLAMRKI